MDVASIASAFIAAQMGQMQTTVAAKMMKMNANHSAEIAQMLKAGQESLKSLANVASGVGQNLDISV